MTRNSDIRYTDRLRLEPVGPQHSADLLRLFQDPAVEKWYGKWTPDKAKEEAARGQRGWEVDGVHKWIAYDRHTGRLVGRGGLSRTTVEGRNRLEIGWVLLGKYHGQGYASEIGRAGLQFAFDELSADEVVSFTETRNAASRKVMARLGFQFDHEFIWPDDGIPCVLYLLKREEWLGGARKIDK